MTGFKILVASVIIVFTIWLAAMPSIVEYCKDQPKSGKFPDRIMHNPLDPWFYK